MLRQRYSFNHPWRDVDQLQREFNRLFESLANTRAQVAPSDPALNVWTNEEGAAVTAELPGVNPEDIDISVVGQTLTLTGLRRPHDLAEGERFHRRERSAGRFNRTVELPFLVEGDKVEAVFEKGVLHVSLPRAEADKPKKIAVKAV
jgi:HSP20 family protein